MDEFRKYPLCVIIVCALITTTTGYRACSDQIKNYPVLNMCKNSSQVQNGRLFLDVFSSVRTNSRCFCYLTAVGNVEIGFDHSIVSGNPCVSKLTLYSNITGEYSFSCLSDNSTLTMNGKDYTMMLLFTTNRAKTDSAYCLQMYQKQGTGSLRLQCYEPTIVNLTTTSTTITSTVPTTPTPTTIPTTTTPTTTPTTTTPTTTPTTTTPTTTPTTTTPTTTPTTLTPSTVPTTPTPTTDLTTPTPSTAATTPTPSPVPSTPTSTAIETPTTDPTKPKPDTLQTTTLTTPGTTKPSEEQPVSEDSFPEKAAIIGGVTGGLILLALILAIIFGRCRREKHPYEQYDNNNASYFDSSRTLTPVSSNYVESGIAGAPVLGKTQTDIQYVEFPSDGEDEEKSPDPAEVERKLEPKKPPVEIVDFPAEGKNTVTEPQTAANPTFVSENEGENDALYATVDKSRKRGKHSYTKLLLNNEPNESASSIVDQSEQRLEQEQVYDNQSEGRTEQDQVMDNQSEGRTEQEQVYDNQSEERLEQEQVMDNQSEGRTEQEQVMDNQSEGEINTDVGRYDDLYSSTDQTGDQLIDVDLSENTSGIAEPSEISDSHYSDNAHDFTDQSEMMNQGSFGQPETSGDESGGITQKSSEKMSVSFAEN